MAATALLDLFRMHMQAVVAWERDLLRRVGLLAPSQDGIFDGLVDELFARWPTEAQDRKAARLCEGVRWAKLHEPAEAALRYAARGRGQVLAAGALSRTSGQHMSWFNDGPHQTC